MGALDIEKRGYLTIKTNSKYIRLLPKTEASLVSYDNSKYGDAKTALDEKGNKMKTVCFDARTKNVLSLYL